MTDEVPLEQAVRTKDGKSHILFIYTVRKYCYLIGLEVPDGTGWRRNSAECGENKFAEAVRTAEK